MRTWHEVTWYSKLGAFLLFLSFALACAFYAGAQYQFIRESHLGVLAAQAPAHELPKVVLKDKGSCASATSAKLLTGPMSFICHGVSANILDTFSWSMGAQTEKKVAFDIHTDSGTQLTDCCGSSPLLALKGRTLSGVLSVAPEYSYLGLDSYLDALKIGLAQNGYVMDPFTIVAHEPALVLAPSWGEGLQSNQTWDFVKVQNGALYVIEAVYIRPPDGKNLSLSVFIADPVMLEALPVVPRF